MACIWCLMVTETILNCSWKLVWGTAAGRCWEYLPVSFL